MDDPFLQSLDSDASLPDAVRTLHISTGRYSGQADISRGSGWLVGIFLWVAGLPRPGGMCRSVLRSGESRRIGSGSGILADTGPGRF